MNEDSDDEQMKQKYLKKQKQNNGQISRFQDACALGSDRVDDLQKKKYMNNIFGNKNGPKRASAMVQPSNGTMAISEREQTHNMRQSDLYDGASNPRYNRTGIEREDDLSLEMNKRQKSIDSNKKYSKNLFGSKNSRRLSKEPNDLLLREQLEAQQESSTAHESASQRYTKQHFDEVAISDSNAHSFDYKNTRSTKVALKRTPKEKNQSNKRSLEDEFGDVIQKQIDSNTRKKDQFLGESKDSLLIDDFDLKHSKDLSKANLENQSLVLLAHAPGQLEALYFKTEERLIYNDQEDIQEQFNNFFSNMESSYAKHHTPELQNERDRITAQEFIVHTYLDELRGRIIEDSVLNNCLTVITDVLDELQMIKDASRSMLDNVIQDELIKLIGNSYIEVIEEEESRAEESSIIRDKQRHLLIQQLNSTSNFGRSPDHNREGSLEQSIKFQDTYLFSPGSMHELRQNAMNESQASNFQHTDGNETLEMSKFLKVEPLEDETIEDHDANAVFSSDDDVEDDKSNHDDNRSINFKKSLMYLKKSIKSENQIKQIGVKNFNHTFVGSGKLEFDESPFIFLTSNPKYIDVLCVNCFECVRLLDVDEHSLTCKGTAANHDDDISCSKSLRDINEDSNVEADVADANEKIGKLAKALRIRLIEIECEDQKQTNTILDLDSSNQSQGQSISDWYSTLYAYAQKIELNNDDPNNLMIMLKIMEDFISDVEGLFKKKNFLTQRVIGLQMFTRRLALLTNEKFQILIKRFQHINNMFDTIDRDEWNNMQEELIQANAKLTRQKSQQILYEIRSEISSEKMDSVSEYSDFSAVTAQYALPGSSRKTVNSQSSTSFLNNRIKQQLKQQNYDIERFCSQIPNRELNNPSPMNYRSSQNMKSPTVKVQSRQTCNEVDMVKKTARNQISHALSPLKGGNAFVAQQRGTNLMDQPITSRGQTQQKQSSSRRKPSDFYLEESSPTHTSRSHIRSDINTNLRKHFDSIVIDQMVSLGCRMPPGLTFAELYKRAEANDVNIDDWGLYIRHQLQRATRNK